LSLVKLEVFYSILADRYSEVVLKRKLPGKIFEAKKEMYNYNE